MSNKDGKLPADPRIAKATEARNEQARKDLGYTWKNGK
jgi:hypothetical protein